jgi:hypothetical protein
VVRDKAHQLFVPKSQSMPRLVPCALECTSLSDSTISFNAFFPLQSSREFRILRTITTTSRKRPSFKHRSLRISGELFERMRLAWRQSAGYNLVILFDRTTPRHCQATFCSRNGPQSIPLATITESSCSIPLGRAFSRKHGLVEPTNRNE